jgi:hypothetical protein
VKSASANFTDANYHIAVPIRTTAGNFIGVIVQNSPYCPAVSVSDTGGSVYSLLINNTLGGGSSYLTMFGTAGTGSIASTSVTVTVSHTAQNGTCNQSTPTPLDTYSAAMVVEYSGAINTLGQTNENENASPVEPQCGVNEVASHDVLVTGISYARYATLTANSGTTIRISTVSGFQSGGEADATGGTLPSSINVGFTENPDSVWWTGCVELRTA